MKIKILSAPTSCGTNLDGCEKAPDRLLDMGLQGIIGEYFPVIENQGSASFWPKSKNSEDKPKIAFPENVILYFNTVKRNNHVLYRRAKEITIGDDFTLFLGGDHSISIGSIRGLLQNHPDTAVVWLDAHTDLNSPGKSPSRKAHGMAAAALLDAGVLNEEDLKTLELTGEERKKFKEYYRDFCIYSEDSPNQSECFNESSLFMLGQRWFELDKCERERLGCDEKTGEVLPVDKRKIFYRTADEIRKWGVESALDEIIKKTKDKRLHLSFDIDVLDKSIVPKTGTPVIQGLDIPTVKDIVKRLAKTGRLRSMDFVELNPEHNKEFDKDDMTEKVALELLEEVFSNLE